MDKKAKPILDFTVLLAADVIGVEWQKADVREILVPTDELFRGIQLNTEVGGKVEALRYMKIINSNRHWSRFNLRACGPVLGPIV